MTLETHAAGAVPATSGPVPRAGSAQIHILIEQIGHSARASKAAGENPHAAIDLVRRSGLGALRIPVAEGGGGCSVREFFSTFIDLAAADADIAHILRAHFWFTEERLRAHDPVLQEIVGRIAAIAFAAEAAVLAAAEAQDAALGSIVNGRADLELTHRASLLAAQAKVMIDELAPRAATALFDVGGSSAVKQSADLDRHWRNIRTLSSHNPTVFKARAIGDYFVNDERLPMNGYF